MFFQWMLALMCVAPGQTFNTALHLSSASPWALHALEAQEKSDAAQAKVDASLPQEKASLPQEKASLPQEKTDSKKEKKNADCPGCSINPLLSEKFSPLPSLPEASPSKNEGHPRFNNHPLDAALSANQFLTNLLNRDWEALSELAAFPFWLESKPHASLQDLRQAWEVQLSQKRLENYEIRGMELLTLAQMKERFGPVPERLKHFLQARAKHLFAVANVSGKAVVLLLRESPVTRSEAFSYMLSQAKAHSHVELPSVAYKVVAFHD